MQNPRSDVSTLTECEGGRVGRGGVRLWRPARDEELREEEEGGGEESAGLSRRCMDSEGAAASEDDEARLSRVEGRSYCEALPPRLPAPALPSSLSLLGSPWELLLTVWP